MIFAGTTRLSNTNDALTSVGSITFYSTAGSFVISGSGLSISGGVTNNSTNSQTINLNLSLSAPQQFNAASGNLNIGGAVNLGSNTLTITGSANTVIGGAISGGGAIAKSGTGSATLSGSNSYSGGTSVTAGTLVAANANALGTGALSISSSATAKLAVGIGGKPVVLPSVYNRWQCLSHRHARHRLQQNGDYQHQLCRRPNGL